MKKWSVFLSVLCFLIGATSYPIWKEKIDVLLREPITKENTITSIEQLEQRVRQNLEEGKTEETLYIKGVEKEELASINTNLDGYYGYVDSYYLAKWPIKGMYKIRLKYQLSDNYYAYHYITEGLDISEHESAKVLADKAKQILDTIIKDGMSDYEKEQAIHDYIIKNGQYDFLTGEKEEDSYHAKGILLEGKGVCSSYSESMQLLLSLAGVESKIVIGKADVEHSWNLVNINGAWYHVDATWDDPVPDEKGRVLYNYFNVPDELMKKTHTWKTQYYEAATSYDENYYARRGDLCKTYEEAKQRILEGLKKKETKISLLLTGKNAKDYSYNFVLQNENVANIQWKHLGESPCLVMEMTVTYQ